MKKKNNGMMVFAGIAFEMVGLCFGGFILGGMIDAHYGWKGYAQVSLVLVLLIGWFVHLIFLIKKFEKDNADDNPS
jgi:hypothetical protein